MLSWSVVEGHDRTTWLEKDHQKWESINYHTKPSVTMDGKHSAPTEPKKQTEKSKPVMLRNNLQIVSYCTRSIIQCVSASFCLSHPSFLLKSVKNVTAKLNLNWYTGLQLLRFLYDSSPFSIPIKHHIIWVMKLAIRSPTHSANICLKPHALKKCLRSWLVHWQLWLI